MLPYYILLIIVSLLLYNVHKNRLLGYHSKMLWFLVIVVLVFFAGFRDSSVGTDSGSYAQSFMAGSMWKDKEMSSLWDYLNSEPGYELLMRIASYIGDNYWALFSLIALFAVGPVFWVIKKESPNAMISVFVFLCLGYYTFCFNAARQSIAVGFFYLAVQYLFKRDFKRYMLFVLIAATFHKTVIITLPLYFLFKRKFSIIQLILLIGGAGIIAKLLPILLAYGSSLERRYELYSSGNATGGEMLTVFYSALPCFFYYWRKFIPKENKEKYDTYLQMLIVGSIIYIVVTFSGAYVELTRFAAYFTVSAVFLWAEVFSNKNKKNRPNPLLATIIILGHLSFFAIFLSKMAGLTPFVWNKMLF